MIKLDAYKQAALRDGWSPERVKSRFENAALKGLLPPDAYENLPEDEAEAFIQMQLERKRDVDRRLATGDTALRVRMMTNIALMRKRHEHN